ncbi:ribokinase [Ferruginibacter sp. HRS2-29]|uniref:ribokinase n=1 Tax=Ferruginibacter sp. HRS2-29 TaxID=2487334 RepID=UPI0020CD730F|nr:ribokinase [Ferruginibacter sp. HRS2-29]MCP9750957.1 ribokinase [Ferruginibacter sp. HRS2-29]
MKKIIVVGSANTDMVVKAKSLPLPGETLLGGTFFMYAGGKGANQAVAAARLGGEVTLVAKVGNDIFGQETTLNLQKENINTDFVFVDENVPSGTALIMVNEEGENCIVVAPGANSYLLPADIVAVEFLHEAEIILMQLETPVATIEAVAKKAKANNQKVIINPAPAQKLSDELLNGLFLITPNETEASLLSGVTVTDEASAAEAAAIFLTKGVQNVIITLGKHGAYFQNQDQRLKIDAPVVHAKDTTAAGDTFSGALAVAVTEEMDWDSAIKFAVQAASISVTKMGAQASIPYRNEIAEEIENTKKSGLLL